MNILTFDIEEWFHIDFKRYPNLENRWEKFESRIHQNMDKIYRMLDEFEPKGTFFCIGWLARKYPEILKRIDSYGHEIASHSDLHELVYLQSPKEFKTDFERAINSIEDVVGKKVRAYRAPAFSIKKENKWAFETIIENGIEIDCSIFPAQRDYGGFDEFTSAKPCWIEYAGTRIKEFPMNATSVYGKTLIFSGGGYFRFLPYRVIQNMMKSSEYVMAYFHPRDFDKGQPMLKEIPLHRKFKSYVGLGGAEKKFENLLRDFEFMDIRTAEQQIDWAAAEVVKLE